MFELIFAINLRTNYFARYNGGTYIPVAKRPSVGVNKSKCGLGSDKCEKNS